MASRRGLAEITYSMNKLKEFKLWNKLIAFGILRDKFLSGVLKSQASKPLVGCVKTIPKSDSQNIKH